MSGPGRDAVLAALREVQDPELHRGIVDLGMVGDVDVTAGRVLVAIRLTVAGCPLKAEIQRRVTEALAPLPGVETVHVTMDVMTDEERRGLRAGLTGEQRPSRTSTSPTMPRSTMLRCSSGSWTPRRSSITASRVGADPLT